MNRMSKIYKVAVVVIDILIILFIASVCCALLSGCATGHSLMTVDRGVGFHLRVPFFFDNSGQTSVFDLKVGSIDSASAIIRGGTTFSGNNAKGGGLGSVSTGDYFVMSSNPNLTEGHLKEVFISPNVDERTKQLLAEYLVKNPGSPKPLPASAISINAGVSSGEPTPDIKFATTGFDKYADVIPVVTTNVADTVQDVSKNALNAVPGYLKSYHVLLALTYVSVLTLLIVLGFLIFKWLFGLFHKKQN